MSSSNSIIEDSTSPSSSSDDEQDLKKVIEDQELHMPSTVHLLNYSASRIRTAALRCMERPPEIQHTLWWWGGMKMELVRYIFCALLALGKCDQIKRNAAYLAGHGLAYHINVNIPEIIRLVLRWTDSNFRDEEAAKMIADAEGPSADRDGPTRELPSYWDDWWNLPEDLENSPQEAWCTRYMRRDFRGILHYAAQVSSVRNLSVIPSLT
jgi:hypothetical protein